MATELNSYEEAGLGPKFLERLAQANLASWQAINELIANSIDSWMDFPKDRPQLIININIEQKNNLDKATIIVEDNANGMDLQTLKKAVHGFLDSDKENNKKNAKNYLGMFGFGLLGAAFTLGTDFTVVTTMDNKTHFKATGNVNKFKEDKKFDIEEYKPNTQEKKMFKKGGTRLLIKDFNGKLTRNHTRRYISHSWRYFMNDNSFGKKVKINLEWNGEKEEMLPFKLGQFNDRPVIDETIVPIEFDLSYKPRRGEEIKTIKITGKVGLSVKGGQNYLAGGLNLYRRGQLIEHTNREFYNWGAMTAKLHGDLEIDLPVTMQKGGFDKQSEGWQELMKQYGPDSDFWKRYTKWSGKFESSISEKPDSQEYKEFIAAYKKEFGIKLSREEQKLLSSGGSTDNDNDNSDDSSPTKPVQEEEVQDQEIKFKIKDLENFTIDKVKYEIIRTALSDDSKGPWFVMPVDNKINIGFNSNSDIYETITDAFKKINNNKIAELSIKAIYLDCIRQFLKSEGFEQDFIIKFSNSYLEQ